jgi:hypothetical protein
MMTPAQFVTQCESVIDQMALLYAHSPAGAMEPHLERFKENITVQWIETFGEFVPHDKVREVVAYMAGRIQTRRREIEAGGAGTA